jgi:hypothetical protein
VSYCKREVRPADAVEKPILIVALERITLLYGLKFLSLVQAIDANDREFDTLLDKAIRRKLPVVGDEGLVRKPKRPSCPVSCQVRSSNQSQCRESDVIK